MGRKGEREFSVTGHTPRPGRVWAVFFTLVFILLVQPAAFAPANSQRHEASGSTGSVGQRRVLLINSYHQGFRWTDDIVRAAVSTIRERLPDVEIHIEYMDAKRVISAEAELNFRKMLAIKYKEAPPEVIIVSDDAALTFVEAVHAEIFPEIPVVFCGINDLYAAANVQRKYFTGIIESMDISANVALAARLMPEVRNIAVITDGTSTGRGARQEIIDSAKNFPRIKFFYFNGEDMTTEELLVGLRQLPEDAVAICPAWYLDKDGATYTNTVIYPLITENCPVPVIGNSSANLGLGVIGGKMNSGETQGAYAARQALLILIYNARPADIPIQTDSQNEYLFDARVMERFGVAPARLPAASRILFAQPTFYESYRALVWTVIGIFALFVALIVVLVISVHRLRRARESLARGEEKLRTTLNSIGDAVISTDRNARIVSMNPVAERLTGWSLGQAQGRPIGEVFCVSASGDTAPRHDPVALALDGGSGNAVAPGVLRSAGDGTERLVSDSCAAIRNAAGDITGAVLVFRDVTEECHREEQLRQSLKMEALGKLAGGIAHDFNNMLGGIIGGAEIIGLRVNKSDAELTEMLDMVTQTAERAADLTNKLLSFSRKGMLVNTTFDAHRSIADGVAILSRTIDKMVTLEQNLSAHDSRITGDPAQIQNVIINLGINAAHAMTSGGRLTISTANVELEESYCKASQFEITPGSYLQIAVRDTGCGIPPEILPRIFEPFFTTKEAGKGTGLGLAAVYGTVKEHHGCITVYSEPGEGTLFDTYLPLAHAALAVPHPPEPEQPRGSGKILVVDDEKVIRATATHILEGLGYEVILAEDGMQALELYSAQYAEIDLVLLDLVMPKMEGRECLEQIKRINPGARVIISSGFAREGGLPELLANSICGFIKKPYRRADLAGAVAKVLARD